MKRKTHGAQRPRKRAKRVSAKANLQVMPELTDMATATPEHECRHDRSLSLSPSPRGGGELSESPRDFHDNELGEKANTVQRSESRAQQFIQRFPRTPHGAATMRMVVRAPLCGLAPPRPRSLPPPPCAPASRLRPDAVQAWILSASLVCWRTSLLSKTAHDCVSRKACACWHWPA